MDAKTRSHIVSIIDDVDDMTVATVRDDGYPQATTVSYVNDGLAIYFATSAHAQKAANIAKCDKVSLTINRPYQRWEEIEGVSIAGRAHRVTDPAELDKAGALMFEKFPQVANFALEDVGEMVFIRIDPEFVSLLDYRRGFGHTELIAV